MRQLGTRAYLIKTIKRTKNPLYLTKFYSMKAVLVRKTVSIFQSAEKYFAKNLLRKES